MVSPTVVWCVSAPLLPVTVIVVVPAGVLALVLIVSVDDEVAGFALKLAEAPAGNPPAARSTAPPNPFEPLIESAYDALTPAATDWLGGEAPRVKSGGG